MSYTATEIREISDALFNDGKLERLTDVYAEDMVMHNVPAGTDYEGRAAFEAWIEANRTGYQDFHVEIEDVVIGDQKVVIQYVVTGTHEGPLPELDVEPTHRPVEFHGATVNRLDGGKIAEAWWYYDRLGLLQQLGLVPEQPTP
jgi:steroid delta-isomerase-like uncharacterized protein